MRKQILRLCVFCRVRARSQQMTDRMLVMQLPAADVPGFVASIAELDADLARDLGTMLHKRPERVPLEDVMEFVDLWLDHHRGGAR
jgi:hypothetical protein